MTPELRVHPEARREFNDAVDYYERESPGLGLLFTNEVGAGFARIRDYESRDDCLMVLAVAHQRKRPHYWRIRQSP